MTRYLLLSLVVLLLLQLCHLVRGKTDPPNVSAFNVVYKSLNSPSQLSGWSSSGGDPCGDDWKGITCSGSSVECLGLSGTLGYQLSSLTSVTYFDFSKNNLNGDIPYQLPPNSVHINLAGNTFTGGILHSISQMTELNYLNLANNQLSGQLTDMFGGLPKLSFILKPRMEQSLVRWATPQLHDIDALAGMVDPALFGLYPPKSLSRFTDVIAFCIQVEPEFRPAMSEVVHSLIRCIQLTSFNRRMGGDLSTTRAAMIPMDTIEESFELIEHSFNSIKGHHHNLLDQSTALLIDWCTMSSEENLMEFMSLPFSVQESML